MGTHCSFGYLKEKEGDIKYVSASINGNPECMGEYIFQTLKTEGKVGFDRIMKEYLDRYNQDLEVEDQIEIEGISDTEWTFAEWIYLWRKSTDSLLVCVPDVESSGENVLKRTNANPYQPNKPLIVRKVYEIPLSSKESLMAVCKRQKKEREEYERKTL